MTQRSLWLDVSAGVAGDMLLGALLDAGAPLEDVRAAVEAVLPGAITLSVREVRRAGLRASKVDVDVVATDVDRRWRDIETLLDRAVLDEPVRRDARAVFARIAGVEGRVHGIPPADVHFHEVGALDAIADVVGTCAALHALDVGEIVAGPMALGSGEVSVAHGRMGVPVPAVLGLVQDWTVSATGDRELATPTGAALITTLAQRCGPLPEMQLETVGVGAGTRDPAGRANVVRAVLGSALQPAERSERQFVVEANVDDLDPRLWPTVLDALFGAGAVDAWLTPILMKKGRPAHTVHALTAAEHVDAVRRAMIANTTTIGVRVVAVDKHALDRTFVTVTVEGTAIGVKLAVEDGVILRATPEFEDVRRLADRLGRPAVDVLRSAEGAARDAGLTAGAPVTAARSV